MRLENSILFDLPKKESRKVDFDEHFFAFFLGASSAWLSSLSELLVLFCLEMCDGLIVRSLLFSTFIVIVTCIWHAVCAAFATPGSANLVRSLKVLWAESVWHADDGTTVLARRTGSFLCMPSKKSFAWHLQRRLNSQTSAVYKSKRVTESQKWSKKEILWSNIRTLHICNEFLNKARCNFQNVVFVRNQSCNL